MLEQQIKEREHALDYPLKQLVFTALNGTSDWGEALEIGRQRMERKAAASKEFDGVVEGYSVTMQRIARMYARFAEIYESTFEPLEEILRTARHGVASQIMAEFPDSNDAQAVAGHLRADSPSEWLDEFDPNED